MVISDDGHVFGSPGDAIFRATSSADIAAVMFIDSPAPGFEESENAMLNAPFEFRGVDSFNNAVFHCRVTRTSGTINAVYRQNFSDNSLTLLHADGITEFPSQGDSTVTVGTKKKDVAVLGDGTVFIRAAVGTGSRSGFWEIGLDGSIKLIKFFDEFTEVETDLGGVGFRSIAVDFADWAVADDHSISLNWAGNILSIGNFTSAISAISETAGVEVTTKGDVSAAGNSGDGVVLSGPSILTLNVLGGSDYDDDWRSLFGSVLVLSYGD